MLHRKGSAPSCALKIADLQIADPSCARPLNVLSVSKHKRSRADRYFFRVNPSLLMEPHLQRCIIRGDMTHIYVAHAVKPSARAETACETCPTSEPRIFNPHGVYAAPCNRFEDHLTEEKPPFCCCFQPDDHPAFFPPDRSHVTRRGKPRPRCHVSTRVKGF